MPWSSATVATVNALTYPPGTRWRYRSRRYSDVEKVGDLDLTWELSRDWITDDFTPDQISAEDLLERWLVWVWEARPFDEDLGVPHVPIRWSVRGEDSATFEAAPPIRPFGVHARRDHFLTIYTHPEDEQTEEPVNWLRLPVRDKLWRPGSGDKGGFVQEATGFKPHALQPALDLRVLGAAGVDWGDRTA